MMHPDSARRSEAGFTILEGMIATAVLGFGLLTLAMMQLAAVSQGASGRHFGEASAIARTNLEQIHRVPWIELTDAQAVGTWTPTDWPGATGVVNATLAAPSGGTNITKAYTIDWQVDNVLDGVGAPRPCLRDIEVRVTWPEEDRTNDRSLTLVTRRYNWGGASC